MRIADRTRFGRILDAAGELFGGRPYYDVHVADIAALADVAKGSVYQHFKNKEQLFLAVTVETMQRLFTEVRATIDEVADPSEKLFRYIYEVLTFFSERPHLYEFVEHVDRTVHPSNAELLKVCDSYEKLVASVIRDMHGAAWSKPDIPFAAMALRSILCETLRTSANPPDDPLATAQRIHALFADGICCETRPRRRRKP